MEWNQIEKFESEKVGGICGGNGKETEWNFFCQIMWKQILMEWNGSGMEMEWKNSSDKVYIGNGNGVDKKNELSG